MNKAIQNISLNDLKGIWENQTKDINLTIFETGKYDLIDNSTKKRFKGKIELEYLPVSNTLLLSLENYFNIELFQLVDGEILLCFDNMKLLFKKKY